MNDGYKLLEIEVNKFVNLLYEFWLSEGGVVCLQQCTQCKTKAYFSQSLSPNQIAVSAIAGKGFGNGRCVGI